MSGAVEHVEIEYSLLMNAENAYSEIRKLEITIMRLMGIIGKMSGGNPDLQQAIMMIQRTIMWIRQLIMVIHILEIASGPVGWIYAAVSAAGFLVSTSDAFADGIRTVS